jgi:hypothetical protein
VHQLVQICSGIDTVKIFKNREMKRGGMRMPERQMMDGRLTDGVAQPLEGAVTSRSINWTDIALTNDEVFASGLHDLGVPDDEAAQGVALLRRVSRELDAVDDEISDFHERIKNLNFFMTPPALMELYNKKRTIRMRLDDWLNSKEIRIDRVEHLPLKIPVFVLSAPGVAMCSASFSTSTELTRNLNCNVKVYGSGIAGGSEVACETQCEFAVEAGKAKVVFIPAELTVGEVSVTKKGEAVGRGRNIQAIEFPHQPAVALVPEDVSLQRGALQTSYPLEEDTTGDISTYRYQYRQSNTARFTLGVQAFGMNVTLEADVSISQWVELSYTLKGGYRYSLYSLEKQQGITWDVSR